MPYVKPKQRESLNPKIDELFGQGLTKGEVNYCITRLVHLWVLDVGRTNRLSYAVLSEGHSVLQDAAAEYYRAVMAFPESLKADENGPVSELDGGNLDVE